jgi:hypothetical protein
MKNLMKCASIVLASAMVMTAVSCSKTGSVTYEVTQGTVEVKITSNIGDNGAVRAVPAAVGGTWTASDDMGVFMVTNASRTVVTGANNKKYVTSLGGETGSFSPDGTANALYYPALAANKVDFIAYSPYNAYGSNISTLTTDVPVDVSDQTTNQQKIDLLYADSYVTKAAGYNRLDYAPVALTFEHRLSNLVINVTSDDISAQDLEDHLTAVEIQGLNTTASFHLSGGTLDNWGNPANIAAREVTAGEQYDAIVLPESYTALKVKFTVYGSANNDGTYTWTAAAGSFEAKKRYTCTLKLVEKGAVLISATITDWVDVPLTGGDATE